MKITSRIQSRKQKKIKVREKEKKCGKKSCIADCKFHYVQKYSRIERDAIYFHLIVISLLPENFGSKICQISVKNNFSVAAVVYADGVVCLSFLEDIVPHFCNFFIFQFGSYKWRFNHNEIITIEDEAIMCGRSTVSSQLSDTLKLSGFHAFLHNRFNL